MRALVEGRKIVLAGGLVAGATGRVKRFRELGADQTLVVAGGLGTGDLPCPDDAVWVVASRGGEGIVAGLRAEEAMLADPPPEVLEALERFDPAGEALVLSNVAGGSNYLGDRPIFGARPPEWSELEDKTVIDELFDRWKVRRAPSEVVPTDAARLRRAAASLDTGLGTAWAGDARDGFHGAAEFLRWVRSQRDADEALVFFKEHCDTVRVMPFLEGVPCSIHGFVFPDGVARLRPVELVSLRPRDRARVLYAGCSTFWDPNPGDRDEMREVARRTGVGLAASVGYRGSFTVDGVLTADGFLPTEMNPRLGGGVATMGRGLPEVPFDLLQCALVAGHSSGIAANEFEKEIVAAADSSRSGGTWSVTSVAPSFDGTAEHDLVLEEDACRLAERDETPTARLSYGPGPVGGFLRVQFDPVRTPVGPSVARRAVTALHFADRLYATGFGPLAPSRPAR
jgi:hypothetical protein